MAARCEVPELRVNSNHEANQLNSNLQLVLMPKFTYSGILTQKLNLLPKSLFRWGKNGVDLIDYILSALKSLDKVHREIDRKLTNGGR